MGVYLSRGLEGPFMDALKSGELTPILQQVKNDRQNI
jgi:hypothetical protein